MKGQNNSSFFLPGLNGLRAFAAFSVIIMHINTNLPAFNLPSKKWLLIAAYGVTIFFTVSGFLITYLLLLEKEKTGNISLRKFYMRRILRIWPLYYLYLLLAGIVFFIFQLDGGVMRLGNLLLYIFFMPNVPYILNSTLPNLPHYWSLGVEEQFYVFWPLLVKKARKIINVLLVFFILFFLLKIGAFLIYKLNGLYWPYKMFLVNRFDCMAIGGIGACLVHSGHRVIDLMKNKIVQVITWIIVIAAALNKIILQHTLVDHTFFSLITLIVIVNVSFNKQTIVSLDFRIFEFLGKISYGLYVYHFLVIFLTAKIVNQFNLPSDIKTGIVYAIIISTTIIISFLSYKYFEQPFLKFKNRFEIIKSQSSRSV